MKELKDDSDHSQWTKIESTFRERAQTHEKSAGYDMFIIIITLFVCILIFAGTDKLSDWLFRTSAERQADIELADAKAEVYRSFASLGNPVSEFIRSLPPKIKPFLEEMLSEYLKQPKAPVLPARPKLPDTFPTTPNKSTEPNKTPIIREGRAFLDKQSDVSARIRRDVKNAPTLTNTEQVTKLYDTLSRLYEKYSELHLSLELEREGRNDLIDKEYIEQVRNDTQINIAQIRSDADREIAESKANAEIDIAREETLRAEELNVLVSGAFTRIGSVVMVIWLTRIFVKKRQRSIKVSAFYLGVADAIAMSREQNPDDFKDLLPHLLPPDTEEDDGSETPIEQLAKIMDAVKHSD